jgi:hypothetical protein
VRRRGRDGEAVGGLGVRLVVYTGAKRAYTLGYVLYIEFKSILGAAVVFCTRSSCFYRFSNLFVEQIAYKIAIIYLSLIRPDSLVGLLS